MLEGGDGVGLDASHRTNQKKNNKRQQNHYRAGF